MLRLAPGSAATRGKRSLVLRSCKNVPLGKVIAAVGRPSASTEGAVVKVGCNVCAAPVEIAMQFTRSARPNMQQLNGLRALANNGITSKGLFIVVASQPLYGIGLAKFWKKINFCSLAKSTGQDGKLAATTALSGSFVTKVDELASPE